MGRGSANSLAPGFRFHPTDEELVRYYLKRKVSGMPFRFDPISEIDIYKIEPWDLPGRSKLKTRDLEWYFFSGLDKKYGNGSRTNRATEKGYWKTTGKDRAVMHNSRTVGMKKTLVFHRGRAPKGERSNWVMHEYRLAGEDLEKFGVVEDAVVLCRIFQKSGTGPKNGEHYGAPFVEEEWDDDDSEEEEEEAFVPGEVLPPDEFVYDDPHGPEVYVEVNDVHQNIGYGISSGNAPQPLNFYYGEASHYFENSGSNVESDQKPVISSVETQCVSEQKDEQKFFDLPGQYEKPVKEEHSVDLINNVDSAGDDYLLDEPYVDAIDNNLASTDGLFLETNDLSNPIEPDAADYDMLEEYLAFFDAADDNMTFDPSQLLENNTLVNQTSLTQTDANGLNEGSQYNTEENGRAAASSSMHNPEALKFESDVKYPSFIKKASEMLGSIPAPPAFASEFPSKEAALRLSQLSQSPVNVTTGMIQIRNVSLSGNAMDWSFGKNGDLNITLSFNLRSDVSPASSSGFVGKAGPGPVPVPVVSSSWLCLMFFWVLLLVSISFKVSSCIYNR